MEDISSTRNISASTAGLSVNRLITQLEITHVHPGVGRRHGLDLTLEELYVGGASPIARKMAWTAWLAVTGVLGAAVPSPAAATGIRPAHIRWSARFP